MRTASRRTISVAALALSLASASCGASDFTPADDPRILTAHRAYGAIGMILEGDVVTGELSQNGRSIVQRELAAFRCYQFLLLGERGLDELSLEVRGPDGREIDERRVEDGVAALRVCPTTGGRYDAVVHARRRGGRYSLSTWSAALSYCSSPIELAVEDAARPGAHHLQWVVDGSTTEARDNLPVACAEGESPDQIYRVHVGEPSLLRAQVESTYDGTITLSKSCGGRAESILSCNDDAGDRRHSLVSSLVEPGDYYVVVDGWNGESGDYRLVVDAIGADRLDRDVCATATSIRLGEWIALEEPTTDWLDASCKPRAGPERVFELRLDRQSWVTAQLGGSGRGNVYVRDGCSAPGRELACVGNAQPLAKLLDPGVHYVIVEDYDPNARLLVTAQDPNASARPCGDVDVGVLPLDGSIRGTTVGATNDFEAQCADGAASPDAVYSLRLEERSVVRLFLMSTHDAALHVRAGACLDSSAEIACNDDAEGIDSTHAMLVRELPAGDYFVIVDGYSSSNAGEYDLRVITSRPGRVPPPSATPAAR